MVALLVAPRVMQELEEALAASSRQRWEAEEASGEGIALR
ncbi:hypothetical protein SHIRM173S_03523 [Streptomyces hirsutus]